MADTVSVTHLLEAIRDRRDNGGGSASYQQACNHIIEAVQVLASTQPAPAFPREEVERALERARLRIGYVAIEAMGGDNLAVTLCSHFDNPNGEQDENGWSEDAVAGCDATLAAVHQVYTDAIAALLQGKQP